MSALFSAGWLTLDAVTVGAAVFHAWRAERWSFRCALGLLIAVAASGFASTAFGLQEAFASVAAVDPSLKAILLAKGISEAMNCAAFAVGILPLWVPPFVIGEVRRARRRRAGTAQASAHR